MQNTGGPRLELSAGLAVLGAFAFCSSGVASIALPAALCAVGESAFAHCPALSSVMLPEAPGRLSLGATAFEDCAALRALALPAWLDHLGPRAFAASGLECIELPERLRALPRGAFEACTSGAAAAGESDSSASSSASGPVDTRLECVNVRHRRVALCWRALLIDLTCPIFCHIVIHLEQREGTIESAGRPSRGARASRQPAKTLGAGGGDPKIANMKEIPLNDNDTFNLFFTSG